MTTTPSGAQFEILVDGKPRSYRDIKAVAIASAEFLKSKSPNSAVAVKNLKTGEIAIRRKIREAAVLIGTLPVSTIPKRRTYAFR